MTYKINTSDNSINWQSSGVERIIQNVVNLINTYRYEVAYDRTLGLSGNFLDNPSEEAQTQAISEIIDLINEREPRATVESIDFINIDDDGNMAFKVVVDIDEY